MKIDEIIRDIKQFIGKDNQDYDGTVLYTRLPVWVSELEQTLSKDTEILADYNELLETFKHTHRNNGVDDSCAKCGLDLRNKIHHVTI